MVYGREGPDVPHPALVCSCEKSQRHINPTFEEHLAIYRQSLALKAAQAVTEQSPPAAKFPAGSEQDN